jgi:uncharacterized Zn finger protein
MSCKFCSSTNTHTWKFVNPIVECNDCGRMHMPSGSGQ